MTMQDGIKSPYPYAVGISITVFPYGVRTHLVYQLTLIQSSIEAIFLERLKQLGLIVDRPVKPVFDSEDSGAIIDSSQTEKLQDPAAYPVKV